MSIPCVSESITPKLVDFLTLQLVFSAKFDDLDHFFCKVVDIVGHRYFFGMLLTVLL